MKQAFLYSLKKSLPVLVSFIPVGLAYGILMQTSGYNWIWTAGTCVSVFAGSLQFLMVSFFAGGVSLLTVAAMALLLNSRHIFYGIPFIEKWKGYGKWRYFLIFALPDEAFSFDNMGVEHECANMLKGGLAYADLITTVSETYANEIQTWEYGETLDGHLRYHNQKLRGIVNGIAVDMWDPATDSLLVAPYDTSNVIEQKKINKRDLQEQLGLEVDDSKFLVGLISRLTNQKGLDLVTAVVDGIIDDNTQMVVLGTGDYQYEEAFRYFEGKYPGKVCSYISYNEALAHKIYAASDVLLVPSAFEPCGLTQLIAMHYGTIPVVRETGGLRDTVEPYNKYEDTGNGFTFDRYEAGLLYDAIERAKAVYLGHSQSWKNMVIRDMEKDVSWEASAEKYYNLYRELLEGPKPVEEETEVEESAE